MNKVIFSDFTIQNSQLFKWRYMSSIRVRRKSYLWGNNGEQPEVTWPEVTSRKSRDQKRPYPEPEVCYAHALPEVSQYLVWHFHRKWRQWPEVIMCACTTGTFCITTVVVQIHGYRRGGRVCACPTGSCAISPCGTFSPEVGYRKWRQFPAHFS